MMFFDKVLEKPDPDFLPIQIPNQEKKVRSGSPQKDQDPKDWFQLCFLNVSYLAQKTVDYQLIMPIRLMVAMQADPVLRSRLDLLMEHHEERKRETENWARSDSQVVQPIRTRFHQSDWSESFILRCVGLIRTHATQTLAKCNKDRLNYEEEDIVTVRVLYPSMSPMSHSCIPNTRTIHHSNYILEARAMREVRKGEEFTISYTGLAQSNRRDSPPPPPPPPLNTVCMYIV